MPVTSNVSMSFLIESATQDSIYVELPGDRPENEHLSYAGPGAMVGGEAKTLSMVGLVHYNHCGIVGRL